MILPKLRNTFFGRITNELLYCESIFIPILKITMSFFELSYELVFIIMDFLSPLQQRCLRTVCSFFYIDFHEHKQEYKLRFCNSFRMSHHITTSHGNVFIHTHEKLFGKKYTLWKSYRLPSKNILRSYLTKGIRPPLIKLSCIKLPSSVKQISCCIHHSWKAIIIHYRKEGRAYVIIENSETKEIVYLKPMKNNVAMQWIQMEDVPTLVVYDQEGIDTSIIRAFQRINKNFVMIDTPNCYHSVKIYSNYVLARYKTKSYILGIKNGEWHELFQTERLIRFIANDKICYGLKSCEFLNMKTYEINKSNGGNCLYMYENGEKLLYKYYKNIAEYWVSNAKTKYKMHTCRKNNEILHSSEMLNDGTCIFKSRNALNIFIPYVTT